MTVPCRIRITTLSPEGKSVLRAEGTLLRGAGVLRLNYTEEENGEQTETRLTLYPKKAAIKKSGAVSWECELVPGEKKASFYRVGPMAFSVSVFTRRLTLHEGERALTIRLSYLLELEGEERGMDLTFAVKEK